MIVQRHKLTGPLRVAAERYEANAAELAAVPGHARMAEQFRTQAKEARDLADSIDGGEFTTIRLTD